MQTNRTEPNRTETSRTEPNRNKLNRTGPNAQVKAATGATEVLLVVDAMTGQEAAGLTAAFNEAVEITGAVLTKMDGDSRGGAALSVREARVEAAHDASAMPHAFMHSG